MQIVVFFTVLMTALRSIGEDSRQIIHGVDRIKLSFYQGVGLILTLAEHRYITQILFVAYIYAYTFCDKKSVAYIQYEQLLSGTSKFTFPNQYWALNKTNVLKCYSAGKITN